jgi:hypothetical protein
MFWFEGICWRSTRGIFYGRKLILIMVVCINFFCKSLINVLLHDGTEINLKSISCLYDITLHADCGPNLTWFKACEKLDGSVRNFQRSTYNKRGQKQFWWHLIHKYLLSFTAIYFGETLCGAVKLRYFIEP